MKNHVRFCFIMAAWQLGLSAFGWVIVYVTGTFNISAAAGYATGSGIHMLFDAIREHRKQSWRDKRSSDTTNIF